VAIIAVLNSLVAIKGRDAELFEGNENEFSWEHCGHSGQYRHGCA
jgi:hypothetical protein